MNSWINRQEIANILPAPIPSFTEEDIVNKLRLQVKDKLVNRVKQSREVIIKLDCTKEICSSIFNYSSDAKLQITNKDLEGILDAHWFKRIFNRHDAQCISVDTSVFIKLVIRRPTVEYTLYRAQSNQQVRES